MYDTRTKIARGVDGITGCPAQRQTNGPYQEGHRYGAQGAQSYRCSYGRWHLRILQFCIGKIKHYEYQYEGANDFAQQVEQSISYSRPCAEYCQLYIGLGRIVKMIFVHQPC